MLSVNYYKEKIVVTLKIIKYGKEQADKFEWI